MVRFLFGQVLTFRIILQKTVDLYNAVLGGENVKVKTVILGTGVPSVPYISTTMHAAYLPVHFLASVNSVAEVEAILDYAKEKLGRAMQL